MPLAFQLDLFRKHGLEVELINFTGSTGQLLESLATGKANMYAALLVMALVCSALVTLMFRVRDRLLLAWRKGLLTW